MFFLDLLTFDLWRGFGFVRSLWIHVFGGSVDRLRLVLDHGPLFSTGEKLCWRLGVSEARGKTDCGGSDGLWWRGRKVLCWLGG